MDGYRVSIQVVGHAREFFPAGSDRMEVALPDPASVRQILEHIGVSPALVMAVFVNDQLTDKDHVPPDGAKVVLMTPPSGG